MQQHSGSLSSGGGGVATIVLANAICVVHVDSMPKSDCLILYERNIVGQTRHNVENKRPLGVHCITYMHGLQGDAFGNSAGFNFALNFKPYFLAFLIGGPEEGSPFPEPW